VTIVDARELAPATAIETDVCIVGAGAAGITLAHRLAKLGVHSCLVESGGFELQEETQALHDLESSGYPLRRDYMSRARYFGGTCNLWAGRSMLLTAEDFRPREWVPDSGWPIPYVDVHGYYAEAARILDLPMIVGPAAPDFGPRLSADESRLFRQPRLVPTLSFWGRGAKRFGADYKSFLRRTDKVRVLLNASAVSINATADGTSIRSLSARTLAGNALEVRARRFVMSSGGIENARLLLVSRDRHSDGLGNAHDVVGRYFMDHPRAVHGRVHVPAGVKLRLLRGRPLPDGKWQAGIALAPQVQREHGLLNHYATFELQTSGYSAAKYQSFIQTMKVLMRRGHAGSRWSFAKKHLNDLPNMIYLLSPKELMPHQLYRAYVAARDFVPRRPQAQTYVVVYFCEQPPDPLSRVTLSREVDQLGVNKVNLNWHIGEAVYRTIDRMQRILDEDLKDSGVGQIEASTATPEFTDASHHMGTTRMSVDPRKGVVDINCRVHGLANLFMAGSSVFPCAGYANPTLTIVALSLRLAEHLATGAGTDRQRRN